MTRLQAYACILIGGVAIYHHNWPMAAGMAFCAAVFVYFAWMEAEH